jgi:hypothetical protein
MATLGRFSADTIETLGKRAAMICSNPDCGALTAGPTIDEVGSVNLGEAAHIYGLTAKSARYTASLSISELSDITNGIWLCRNCHKSIDNDELRFPVDLLFQWRRMHEAAVLDRFGKPGEQLREKVKSDHLKEFAGTSYLAQQIILDRPPHWEFKLTLEVLRTDLDPIANRWEQLKRGMYVRRATLISADQALDWLSAKARDNAKMVKAFKPLLDDLNKSWGERGVPGNDKQIVGVSRLFGSLAAQLLEWEEEIRFCHLPSKYKELVGMLRGLGGLHLAQIFRIPAEIAKVFEKEDPSGSYHFTLVFELPPNFVRDYEAAMRRAIAS